VARSELRGGMSEKNGGREGGGRVIYPIRVCSVASWKKRKKKKKRKGQGEFDFLNGGGTARRAEFSSGRGEIEGKV